MKRRDTKTATIIALILLVVVATTILMGRTYAKYTSTASGTDTAIVAKWSFKFNGTEIATTTPPTLDINLFDTIKDTDGTTAEGDVATVTGKKIIAPGTSGSFDLVVENSSEVNAEYKIDLVTTEGATLPIEYKVGTEGTWKSAIDSVATTNIAMGATKPVTVYWRWTYAGDDATDTALGIAARDAEQKVTVKATVTATQVD